MEYMNKEICYSILITMYFAILYVWKVCSTNQLDKQYREFLRRITGKLRQYLTFGRQNAILITIACEMFQ